MADGKRTRRIADRQQRIRSLDQRAGLAAPELGRNLAGLDELLLQATRPVEDVFDEGAWDAHRVAKPLRQIEHETVGGFGGGGERVFGALTLLVRNLPLLHRYAPLPIGQTGEHKGEDEARRQAAG